MSNRGPVFALILFAAALPAFGVLVAGPSKSRPDVWVTFVDAKSGEALAYTRVLSMGDRFRQDPAKAYAKALTKEFQKMRVGAQGGKKKK
jgi:hypothetical protein